MTEITRSELASLIGEVNGIVVAHNMHHPEYALRTLSEKGAVVVAGSQEVEQWTGLDMALTTALYHREADMVYFIQDEFSEALRKADHAKSCLIVQSP